ncbi:PadR family transcriptional regulator PadR [Chitinivorax tropicus]|uniref:PadR family transcriptional regulator PadR n=1 Tax=Chitinivorax tropicus TaxID=714531 RepID=A0A840MRG6_9PROT|nr:PadR family transcriptional regulator [Chitinivorax tropicus]MBB5019679.1 PadR family transcriptional regulator PadR [Chitinivorax tropicus]
MKTQLKKGTLEMCVLAILDKADGYAYEIVSKLADGVEMSEGTIYPLMRRLQNEAWVTTYLVESESGPPRKYYKLTDTGRKELSAMKQEWHEFLTEVNKILGEGNE